jgi:hypothetical protein
LMYLCRSIIIIENREGSKWISALHGKALTMYYT